MRVVYTLKDHFSPASSLIVLPDSKRAIDRKVKETDSEVIFSTAKLSIVIDKNSGTFQYRESSGNVLAREPERGGKTLDAADSSQAYHTSWNSSGLKRKRYMAWVPTKKA